MSEFDAYSDKYVETVQSSISFCGTELEYFTRRKVEHLLDLVTRHVGDPARCSLLDVGCGIGETDSLLVDRVGELHGADVSADAIARAVERNPRAHYVPYESRTLPYGDARFDVAFAICVVHHVQPQHRAGFFGELHRVVRPGGLVAIFEHNPFNPLTRLAVSRCDFDDDAVLLSRRTSERLLSAARLVPLEARYIIFVPVDRRFVQGAERWLRWLPLAAQHYVAARR